MILPYGFFSTVGRRPEVPAHPRDLQLHSRQWAVAPRWVAVVFDYYYPLATTITTVGVAISLVAPIVQFLQFRPDSRHWPPTPEFVPFLPP